MSATVIAVTAVLEHEGDGHGLLGRPAPVDGRDHRVAALILDDGIYDFRTAFTRQPSPFPVSWIADSRDEEAVTVLSLLTTVNTIIQSGA